MDVVLGVIWIVAIMFACMWFTVTSIQRDIEKRNKQ